MISMNLTLNQLGFEGIDEEHVKAFVGNGSDKYVERSLIFSGDKELKNYEVLGVVFYSKGRPRWRYGQ